MRYANKDARKPYSKRQRSNQWCCGVSSDLPMPSHPLPQPCLRESCSTLPLKEAELQKITDFPDITKERLKTDTSALFV